MGAAALYIEEMNPHPRRLLAPALFLLAACFGNHPLPEWKSSQSPEPNARRVDHLEKILNTQAWQRSPYSRVEDALEMPVYLIVADDRTACIATAEDWTIAAHGDFYPCPGKWRIPRAG